MGLRPSGEKVRDCRPVVIGILPPVDLEGGSRESGVALRIDVRLRDDGEPVGPQFVAAQCSCLGGGPGLYLDFWTFSFHVPRAGSFAGAPACAPKANSRVAATPDYS